VVLCPRGTRYIGTRLGDFADEGVARGVTQGADAVVATVHPSLRAVSSPEAPKTTRTHGGARRSTSTVMCGEHAANEEPRTGPDTGPAGGHGTIRRAGMKACGAGRSRAHRPFGSGMSFHGRTTTRRPLIASPCRLGNARSTAHHRDEGSAQRVGCVGRAGSTRSSTGNAESPLVRRSPRFSAGREGLRSRGLLPSHLRISIGRDAPIRNAGKRVMGPLRVARPWAGPRKSSAMTRLAASLGHR